MEHGGAVSSGSGVDINDFHEITEKHKNYRPSEYHKFSVKIIRFEFNLVSEPINSFLISSPP